MGFNLTIFLAQLVNLFLLVWLLKRFLYGPILAIMDKRRSEITTSIQTADDKLAKATALEENLQKRQRTFEADLQQKYDTLERDMKRQKTLLSKQLDSEFEEKRQKMQQDLVRAWQTSQNSIQQMIATEFLRVSTTVLTEWSNKTPMDQVLQLFQQKVSALTKKKLSLLNQILSVHPTVVIKTSNTLDKHQKAFLNDLLNENFDLPTHFKVVFKTAPDLILGIEMRVGEYLIDWNLKTYLDEMQQNLERNISGLITPSTKG